MAKGKNNRVIGAGTLAGVSRETLDYWRKYNRDAEDARMMNAQRIAKLKAQKEDTE